jgi:hypothetical protein
LIGRDGGLGTPVRLGLPRVTSGNRLHGLEGDRAGQHEAQALWLDDMFIEVPARTQDEPRFVVIGMIAGQHWSAVITYRDEKIRLISVRRSRDEEVMLYEG